MADARPAATFAIRRGALRFDPALPTTALIKRRVSIRYPASQPCSGLQAKGLVPLCAHVQRGLIQFFAVGAGDFGGE